MTKQVSYDDIARVARQLEGEILETAGGRARFKVEVKEGRNGLMIYCIPESSGKARLLSSGSRKALERFNQTGSMRSSDYTDLTYHSVYLLALIDRA